MKLTLSGEVLAIEQTRAGRAVRVIVRDGRVRNAVVLVPPAELEGALKPEIGEDWSIVVQARVDKARDGHLLDSVTYFAADGWPARPGTTEYPVAAGAAS